MTHGCTKGQLFIHHDFLSTACSFYFNILQRSDIGFIRFLWCVMNMTKRGLVVAGVLCPTWSIVNRSFTWKKTFAWWEHTLIKDMSAINDHHPSYKFRLGRPEYEKKLKMFFLRGKPPGLGSMARRFMENIVVGLWSKLNIDDWFVYLFSVCWGCLRNLFLIQNICIRCLLYFV